MFLEGLVQRETTLDANDNMYSSAIAAVEAETKESWNWLLETLISNLGQLPFWGWSFIFD